VCLLSDRLSPDAIVRWDCRRNPDSDAATGVTGARSDEGAQRCAAIAAQSDVRQSVERSISSSPLNDNCDTRLPAVNDVLRSSRMTSNRAQPADGGTDGDDVEQTGHNEAAKIVEADRLEQQVLAPDFERTLPHRTAYTRVEYNLIQNKSVSK